MARFGEVLKQLRKKRKLTQKQLAKRIGLSFSTISMYERGERRPDLEIMETIADFFNVSIDYLYGKAQTLTVYNMDGIEGAHEIQLNSDNINAISSLINEVRSLPPEKIEAIIQLVKTLK